MWIHDFPLYIPYTCTTFRGLRTSEQSLMPQENQIPSLDAARQGEDGGCLHGLPENVTRTDAERTRHGCTRMWTQRGVDRMQSSELATSPGRNGSVLGVQAAGFVLNGSQWGVGCSGVDQEMLGEGHR